MNGRAVMGHVLVQNSSSKSPSRAGAMGDLIQESSGGRCFMLDLSTESHSLFQLYVRRKAWMSVLAIKCKKHQWYHCDRSCVTGAVYVGWMILKQGGKCYRIIFLLEQKNVFCFYASSLQTEFMSHCSAVEITVSNLFPILSWPWC